MFHSLSSSPGKICLRNLPYQFTIFWTYILQGAIPRISLSYYRALTLWLLDEPVCCPKINLTIQCKNVSWAKFTWYKFQLSLWLSNIKDNKLVHTQIFFKHKEHKTIGLTFFLFVCVCVFQWKGK